MSSDGSGQGSFPHTCLSIADWCSISVARSNMPVISTTPIAPIAFPSLSLIGATVTGTPLYAPDEGVIFISWFLEIDFNEDGAVVMAVDDPPVLHPDPVPFERFCCDGEPVDQFMECKDNRFKVGGLCAAGQCIAVHKILNTLVIFYLEEGCAAG